MTSRHSLQIPEALNVKTRQLPNFCLHFLAYR